MPVHLDYVRNHPERADGTRGDAASRWAFFYKAAHLGEILTWGTG